MELLQVSELTKHFQRPSYTDCGGFALGYLSIALLIPFQTLIQLCIHMLPIDMHGAYYVNMGQVNLEL